MLELLTSFIVDHEQYAHFIIFGMLLLAGLSIPISLDLLLIFGGILAASMTMDQIIHLYLWIFAGCCISAWEAYWLGRLLGSNKWDSKWLRKSLTPLRIEKLNNFYAKHGFWTLLVGRFIPFGVRNCLFMTAGMGKMPFWSFVIRDGIACFLSTLFLFAVAYSCGKNSHILYEWFETYRKVIGMVLGIALVGFSLLAWFNHKKKAKLNPTVGE